MRAGIKESKGAIKWTRLSCRLFAANAVSLQLHALAYNLGNFLRTLAAPEPIKDRSLSSLKEKLMKIGAECPTNCASRLGIPNVASSKEQSLRHYRYYQGLLPLTDVEPTSCQAGVSDRRTRAAAQAPYSRSALRAG